MEIFFFIIIVIIGVFVLINLTQPKISTAKKDYYSIANGKSTKEVEFLAADYPDKYSFEVSGVHLQKFAHGVINFAEENVVATLEPEPDNKFDKDAILVKVAGWEIGYVPAIEALDVHDIINKRHVAYVSEKVISSHIRVSVTIRYLNAI